MSYQVTKLSEVESRLKILLWGEPGVGKTPFATSFGEGLHIIDCNQGLLSSKTLRDEWFDNRQKISVTTCYEEAPDKATAWAKFREIIMAISNEVQQKKYPFKVLVIDSFTDIAGFCIRSIRANSGGLAKPMSMQLWGLAIDEIERIFTYIIALPIPVVVIFHSKDVDIGEGSNEKTVTKVGIFGKNLPSNITAMFDEVVKQKVRISSGKMEPYLQVMRDADTVVRTRGQMPDGFLTKLGLRDYLTVLGWKEIK